LIHRTNPLGAGENSPVLSTRLLAKTSHPKSSVAEQLKFYRSVLYIAAD
jgi:hypothetical protein